jgi:hypothetical protein
MLVIDDEDLKRMGYYDEKATIYESDPELLYFRTDD